MKTLKFAALVWLLANPIKIFSQVERFSTQKVENTIIFSGNINNVWTYLSNLGNLQYLVPSTIEKSVLTGNGKGSIVTLTLKDNKGVVVEEVIKLDNKKHVICYTMIQTPMPIKNYVAYFEVKNLENTMLQVTFRATFKVQEKNREARTKAFNALQIELLENIKKITNEK